MVLDRGIDTSTAVGCMFFQIPGYYRRFSTAVMSERVGDAWPPLTLAVALAGKREVAVRKGI